MDVICMLSRNEARKVAMKCLYQVDIMKEARLSYDLNEIMKENLEVENEFVKDILYGVETTWQEIDELANKYLNDWDISRLDKAGAAILRQGIYEMTYTTTPPIVIINEAVELAKEYCDLDLVRIINAVLDKIMKEE